MKRWLYPLALLAALIGLWQLAASSGFMAEVMNLEDFLVPSPAEIVSELWEQRSLLLENGWVTLKGEVDHQYQSDIAFDHVASLYGVTGVTNDIETVERQ